MATLKWRGDAPEVAQVVTATPANVEAGDRFTLMLNGKSVGYTAAAATVADVVAGLVAAVSASAIPEFQELAASNATTHVTLAAKVAGRPFTLTAATTNGGAANTQSLTLATVTPSAGPNHWDLAANWSPAAVPANGDDVYLEDSRASVLYGIQQTGVTLASLHVAASFTGEVGLPATNRQGTADYAEYRPRTLALGATVVNIGRGPGAGSPRLLLNTLAAATNITVHGTGLPADFDLPTLQWQGTHASNALNVLDGSVGVAVGGGELATLATLRQSGGNVRCGAGVTLADIERTGTGQLVLEASAASLDQSGGETLVLGAATLGALTLTGGRVDYRASGAIAAATLDGSSATLDFSADARARTVASCELRRGAIHDPHRTVVYSTGVQPRGSLQAP